MGDIELWDQAEKVHDCSIAVIDNNMNLIFSVCLIVWMALVKDGPSTQEMELSMVLRYLNRFMYNSYSNVHIQVKPLYCGHHWDMSKCPD